jgi:hypothetical protein
VGSVVPSGGVRHAQIRNESLSVVQPVGDTAGPPFPTEPLCGSNKALTIWLLLQTTGADLHLVTAEAIA